MADNNASEYRFAQHVAPSAPKPGFDLATVSFQLGHQVGGQARRRRLPKTVTNM